MAWHMHLPANCRLGKERKQDQQKTKPSFVANSATYAAAAASMVETLTSRPSLPLLDTCKEMMKMKNDGARRHACGSFC
jgi:hypothetical protein